MLVSGYESSASAEVTEVRKQMAALTIELEEHKAKRLAARNEMVGLAKALETAQSEVLELREFIQYTLMPLINEQVNGLESALTFVDMATGVISDKQQGFKLVGHASRLPPPSTKLPAAAEPPKQRRVSNKSTPTAGLMDEAAVLKAELERVKAGIALLGSSIERLNETLRLGDRCCGGLWDVLASAMGCLDTAPKGYSSVEIDESSHSNSSRVKRVSASRSHNVVSADEDAGL